MKKIPNKRRNLISLRLNLYSMKLLKRSCVRWEVEVPSLEYLILILSQEHSYPPSRVIIPLLPKGCQSVAVELKIFSSNNLRGLHRRISSRGCACPFIYWKQVFKPFLVLPSPVAKPEGRRMFHHLCLSPAYIFSAYRQRKTSLRDRYYLIRLLPFPSWSCHLSVLPGRNSPTHCPHTVESSRIVIV